uniref:ATPase AAA-type core domain-containing protein n=1 Tax=Lactuca sativa TaxID=4236 RepID=A0A9R1XIX3_LACSA|nr:hypothetical protein LSAT_V11C300139370 [Lactuca sativa]
MAVSTADDIRFLDSTNRFHHSVRFSKPPFHSTQAEERRGKLDIDGRTVTPIHAKMDELENELSNLVGRHELKLQLRKWAKGMLLDERQRALGLKVGTPRPPHMALLGNPGTGTGTGTGKTMVARILGKLFFMVGILPTDKATEVQRTYLGLLSLSFPVEN